MSTMPITVKMPERINIKLCRNLIRILIIWLPFSSCSMVAKTFITSCMFATGLRVSLMPCQLTTDNNKRRNMVGRRTSASGQGPRRSRLEKETDRQN